MPGPPPAGLARAHTIESKHEGARNLVGQLVKFGAYYRDIAAPFAVRTALVANLGRLFLLSRTLFIQARSVLGKELISHLRRVRSMRASINATRTGQGRGGIIDAVSIRERPAEVEDRAVPGHWEGDLIRGSANSHIATLVERQ